MPYKCFSVRQLPRMLKRPFRLWFVSWMPEHEFWNRHRVLDQAHFCFTLRTDPAPEMIRWIVDGTLHERTGRLPYFSILPAGTRLHTIQTRVVDELMFTLEPQYYDTLMDMSHPQGGEFQMNPHIEQIIHDILESMENIYVPGTVDRLEGLFLRLLEEATLAVSMLQCGQGTDSAIYEIISYIGSHFMEGISLDDVCRKFAIGRRTLYRRWGECFEHSPAEFLLRKRLDYAEQLLSNSNLSIKLIADKCGFDNPVSFAHSFQRENGLSPSRWRTEKSERRE